MQLTDRRIYFTWEDVRRRPDIPLFEDAENAQELPPPIASTLSREFQGLWARRFGGYSFAKWVPLALTQTSFCRKALREIPWVALTLL
jgi:hypothetical protein